MPLLRPKLSASLLSYPRVLETIPLFCALYNGVGKYSFRVHALCDSRKKARENSKNFPGKPELLNTFIRMIQLSSDLKASFFFKK